MPYKAIALRFFICQICWQALPIRNPLRSELSWTLHLKGVPEREIRSGGFVRDTLKAATWCFVNTNGYEACVLAAVNLGDDTDTTAAVAGASQARHTVSTQFHRSGSTPYAVKS